MDTELKPLHFVLLCTLFTVHTVYDYMYSLLNTPEKKNYLMFMWLHGQMQQLKKLNEQSQAAVQA